MMFVALPLLLLFLHTIVKVSNGANILCYIPTPSISHQIPFHPIWRELSLKGHKVTVIITDPINDKSLINLTEIDVHYTYDIMNAIPAMTFSGLLHDQLWKLWFTELFPPMFELQMKHPKIQELMNDPDLRFDLVVVEMYFAPVFALSRKFNCPFVGVLSLQEVPFNHWAVGNPYHPLINQFSVSDYQNPFLQRIWYTFVHIKLMLRFEFEIMPAMDKIAKEYFGNEIPYIEEIERNVSLILTTHNFITSKPKATVPAFIEIANVHIKKNVSLPADLKSELDKETNGMIYFSLGTNVKSASLSENIRNVFLDAFSEIPFKVLLKWETDYLPNKPKNVIIRKWLPQEGVLAHPNVKVFVTQGGLQSMEEAIYYKKPLVGIPFFFDQQKNVKRMSETGIGLELNFQTMTKDELKSAILEVFQNKKYVEKISEISNTVWDQPMTGLETSVWWIEYVIRHKGAKHLRSPLLDIPFYQYLLFDVIGFVLLIFGVMLSLLYFIIRLGTKILSGKTKMKTS